MNINDVNSIRRAPT